MEMYIKSSKYTANVIWAFLLLVGGMCIYLFFALSHGEADQTTSNHDALSIHDRRGEDSQVESGLTDDLDSNQPRELKVRTTDSSSASSADDAMSEFTTESVNRLVSRGATLTEIREFLDISGPDRSAGSAIWMLRDFARICANTLNDKSTIDAAQGNPYREWALSELRHFCGQDQDSWKLDHMDLETQSGYPFTVTEDDLQGFIRDNAFLEAIHFSLNKIGESNDYLEILMYSQGLYDLQAQAFEHTGDPESIVIYPGAASDEEVADASAKAALIFTCEIHGGCDITHPYALSLCVEVGCERNLGSLEEAINRIASPRESDVIQQYLTLFRAQR